MPAAYPLDHPLVQEERRAFYERRRLTDLTARSCRCSRPSTRSSTGTEDLTRTDSRTRGSRTIHSGVLVLGTLQSLCGQQNGSGTRGCATEAAVCLRRESLVLGRSSKNLARSSRKPSRERWARGSAGHCPVPSSGHFIRRTHELFISATRCYVHPVRRAVIATRGIRGHSSGGTAPRKGGAKPISESSRS